MLQTLQWSSPTRSRKCFFQYATTCIPGCQRCHATERPSAGLNDKILRYTNSFVTHDAVPAQHEPLLFHGGVPLALPAPTKSIRFLGLRNLTFKTALSGLGTQCGVVRSRSRLGTLCGTIFSTAEGLFCKCPRDGCLNCLAGATRNVYCKSMVDLNWSLIAHPSRRYISRLRLQCASFFPAQLSMTRLVATVVASTAPVTDRSTVPIARTLT